VTPFKDLHSTNVVMVKIMIVMALLMKNSLTSLDPVSRVQELVKYVDFGVAPQQEDFNVQEDREPQSLSDAMASIMTAMAKQMNISSKSVVMILTMIVMASLMNRSL
jgi:hypothetical protein